MHDLATLKRMNAERESRRRNKMSKATRDEVYSAIDTERDYQDRRMADPTLPHMHPLTAGEQLLAMEVCLQTARQAWYGEGPDYPQSVEYIRKVAGLAVQFMEDHGAPVRK